MTDAELSRELHECLGSSERMVNCFGNPGSYSTDPEWCVSMIMEYGLHVGPVDMTEEWYARKWTERQTVAAEVKAKSVTRAVALAVLALHREGK